MATGYRRTIDRGRHAGAIEVSPTRDRPCAARSRCASPIRARCSSIVERVRRVFDLGADPAVIAEHLGADPLLRRSLARHPGIRTPGAWDGFELAVRAILGQQVSVARRDDARRPHGLACSARRSTRGEGLDAALPDAGAAAAGAARTAGRHRRLARQTIRSLARQRGRREHRVRGCGDRRASVGGALRDPRASATGRRSTSRCGPSASPTRFRAATSSCAAWPATAPRARSSARASPGGPGARTP